LKRDYRRENPVDKADYRKIVKDRRNTSDITALEKDLYNARLITDRYLELDSYKVAGIIFVYSAMAKEIPTQGIIHTALNDGKKVALPKIRTGVKARAEMDFVFINKDTEYKSGVYGILEPVSDEFINVNDIKDKIEMLIPGLCFDVKGRRIGYGGGYYDRYLSKYTEDKFHITALAYEYQIFESLPFTENDKQVNLIVTENRRIEIDVR